MVFIISMSAYTKQPIGCHGNTTKEHPSQYSFILTDFQKLIKGTINKWTCREKLLYIIFQCYVQYFRLNPNVLCARLRFETLRTFNGNTLVSIDTKWYYPWDKLSTFWTIIELISIIVPLYLKRAYSSGEMPNGCVMPLVYWFFSSKYILLRTHLLLITKLFIYLLYLYWRY